LIGALGGDHGTELDAGEDLPSALGKTRADEGRDLAIPDDLEFEIANRRSHALGDRMNLSAGRDTEIGGSFAYQYAPPPARRFVGVAAHFPVAEADHQPSPRR
jgi:hypothetical protein